MLSKSRGLDHRFPVRIGIFSAALVAVAAALPAAARATMPIVPVHPKPQQVDLHASAPQRVVPPSLPPAPSSASGPGPEGDFPGASVPVDPYEPPYPGDYLPDDCDLECRREFQDGPRRQGGIPGKGPDRAENGADGSSPDADPGAPIVDPSRSDGDWVTVVAGAVTEVFPEPDAITGVGLLVTDDLGTFDLDWLIEFGATVDRIQSRLWGDGSPDEPAADEPPVGSADVSVGAGSYGDFSDQTCRGEGDSILDIDERIENGDGGSAACR